MLPPDMFSQPENAKKMRWRPGLRPDPAGGAYSAPSDPLAGLRGPTSKGRRRKKGKGMGKGGERGEGTGGKGRGRKGEGRGGEGNASQFLKF